MLHAVNSIATSLLRAFFQIKEKEMNYRKSSLKIEIYCQLSKIRLSSAVSVSLGGVSKKFCQWSWETK